MKAFLGFRPKYSITNGTLPSVERMMIASSKTIREGGAVQSEGYGIGDMDAADANIVGYVIGFEDKDGFTYGLRTSGFAGASATYTESAAGDTHLSSSDNSDSGSDNVVALVVPAMNVVCSGYLDAAAATTTGSNLAGYYIDIITTVEENLDESSASTTIAQFRLMPGTTKRLATDPEDPSSTRRVMCMAIATEQGAGVAVA